MRQQDLTRRNVLHGTAVIGAASLLARTRQPPAAGREGPAVTGLESVPTSGPRGLVGATVSSAGMGTRTWTEAAHKFDAKVHCPMATSATRIYLKDSPIASWELDEMRRMAAAGVSAVISIKPSRRLRSSGITYLRRSIRQIRATHLKIEAVCLWHEPNDICKNPPPFRSGQQYVDYVRHYGPAVTEMGVPLAYIPLVLTTNGGLQTSYFPGTTWRGKPLVTHIYPDYYCVGQYIHGVRMDASIRLADEHGLRLGLGEFGRTTGRHRASDAEFAAYMRYLRGVYARRQNRGSCIYFSGGPLNDPPPSGCTELGAFYDALTT